ncbi:MAG: MFS transporter [Clostridiales bacterium]|jgi:hypothetical protein|nr:MFS transporter [Clostridiales bacterium]
MIYYRAMSVGRKLNALETPIKLYAHEGVLFSLATLMTNNNNNLFAMRLGASDYELGMLSLVCQLVNMCVLFPGALFIDALKNKRVMVIGSVASTAAIYIVIGFVSAFGNALWAFIILLAASSGAVMLYNLSWQSFFPEVIHIRNRNTTLTLRTYGATLCGILIPLVTGTLLTSMRTTESKISAHQAFFLCAAALLALQITVIVRLKSSAAVEPKRINIGALKSALSSLARSKQFLLYAGIALFFYMAWQVDWTLYFISQTQYIHLNEAQLSLVNILGTLAQLCTLRYWSKMNERRGVVFTMMFGIISLCLNPPAVIVSTLCPAPYNQLVFFVMHTIANLGFVIVNLNLLQCTLQVLDDKNRTLGLSLFTIFTSASNAIMPLTGVMIYKSLGGDVAALRWSFAIVLAMRLAALGVWALRRRIVIKYKWGESATL